MDRIYLYDGSEDGFFTAVFSAYENKERGALVYRKEGFQPRLGETLREVSTDKEKSARVRTKLEKTAGADALQDICTTLRSGDAEAPNKAFRYIAVCLKYGFFAIERQNDPNVFEFCAILQQVRLEVHRFTGFLRFQETAQGYFYAHYAPDNDITALLLPHFTARLRGTPFFIHDVRRNVLAFYNGLTTRVLQGNGQITVFLSENERAFTDLWQTYYEAVNIESRKNERLMRGFMPARYWSHLPEKSKPVASAQPAMPARRETSAEPSAAIRSAAAGLPAAKPAP